MEITYYPNPLLRKIAKPVAKITPQVLQTLDNMLALMYVANDKGGVGLAGPQVGLSERLLVIDPSHEDEERTPYFLINPEIVELSGEDCEYEEGCLSLPGIYAPVVRPEKCILKYLDREGKEQIIKADGFLARVIQHEMDHLNGKLFIDYLSPLRKKIIAKKLKMLEERYG
ncbi:MAG: peptide deformylase [Alphaproteobacteria bacterium]|nr:peptide deformylase [Alphaproteobacteria bacterium]